MGLIKDLIKIGFIGSVTSSAVNKAIETAKTSGVISQPSKCSMNSDVEVTWKHQKNWAGGNEIVCSYSGHENCKKCVKKQHYSKKLK